MAQQVRRIAIIGNGGGGKTTLARALGQIHNLAVTHVDSIQFVAGMKPREPNETARMLDDVIKQPSWVIDGFGSMAVMKRRFLLADKIVFVDFPLWRHYWWCLKRQIKAIFKTREELPAGCYEGMPSQGLKLFKILWKVHTQIRPELLQFFEAPEMKGKVIHVQTLVQWRSLYENGIL